MKQTLTLVSCLSLLAFATPAGSYILADQMMPSATAPSAEAAGKLLQLVRHGADDPAGDDRGGRGRGGKGRGGHDDGPTTRNPTRQNTWTGSGPSLIRFLG